MDSFIEASVIDMQDVALHSFTSLTPMELIPIPNNCSLYLHPSDIQCFRNLFLEEKKVVDLISGGSVSD